MIAHNLRAMLITTLILTIGYCIGDKLGLAIAAMIVFTIQVIF